MVAGGGGADDTDAVAPGQLYERAPDAAVRPEDEDGLPGGRGPACNSTDGLDAGWSDLVSGGVLDRFSDLAVCAVRGGAQAGRHPPGGRLGRLFVDTLIDGHDSLPYVVDAVGAERVMFGTSYPFNGAVGEALAGLERLPTTARTAVAGGNARSLLRCLPRSSGIERPAGSSPLGPSVL